MTSNLLALDIGEKRIGLAVGSLAAFGRGVLNVTSVEQVMDDLRTIITKENITALVVGLPYVKSGDVTPSHQLALQWIERLKSELALPIHTIDESLSSQAAEQQLRAEGIDTQAEKWRVDERSAELILHQFLNETSSP